MKNIIIRLGEAYYNQGFFNIRVGESKLFGEDNTKIKIELGKDSNRIIEEKIKKKD